MAFTGLTSACCRPTQFLVATLITIVFVIGHAGSAHADKNDAAIVVDANTGKVLYASHADDRRYPASLTKMMTLYLTFGLIQDGVLSLTTPIPVSRHAAAEPPTKLGVQPGTTVPLRTAILAMITVSANDMATAVGEYIAGSERLFAQRMTAKAHQLGMTHTQFRNANGLPDVEQFTTARDMARLGIALREHYPKLYRFFSVQSVTYKGRKRNGHNHILNRVKGADGIKTGFTNASGFNVASSVVRNGKRVVAVVMGGRTHRARDDRMVALLKRYMPKASTHYGGPILPPRRNSAYVGLFRLPEHGPIPAERSPIDQRIASAFSGAVSDGIAHIIAQAPSQTVVVAALQEERSKIVPTNLTARSQSTPFDHMTTASTEDAATWAIQIAALPTRRQAIALLRVTRKRNPKLLADAHMTTQSVETDDGTLYRARYGGFPSRDAATHACSSLETVTSGCFEIAP